MSPDSSLERPLPHYVVAEKAVLGVILLDNASFVRAIEKGLKVDDFFLSEHRNVFEAMIRLDEARQPIDSVTLTQDLHRNGKLEASGGAAYISQLADGLPRATN